MQQETSKTDEVVYISDFECLQDSFDYLSNVEDTVSDKAIGEVVGWLETFEPELNSSGNAHAISLQITPEEATLGPLDGSFTSRGWKSEPVDKSTMRGLYERFDELITWTLSFKNAELERQYKLHIENLTCQNLNGSWGAIAVVSCLVIYLVAILIFTTLVEYWKTSKQGSILRTLFLTPVFLFSSFTAWNLFLKVENHCFTSVQCERWAIRLLVLLVVTELCLSFVDDFQSNERGCDHTRFRCQFSFAAPPMVSRFMVMDAVTNFFIMPSLSFLWMVFFNVGVQFPARLVPFLVHGWESTSFWMLSCVCLQSLQLLHCRYARELSDRRNFVLQADAFAWHERVQSILDGMIPPRFQGTARAGASALEFRDAAVLFCSFPKEGWVGRDPMDTFHRLSRVYREFDAFVAAEPLACKVEHVGNDYLVVSCIFGPPPAPHPAGPDAERARDCAALAALGGRMMATARAALGDGGIELRAGVACGPVVAAIIGRSRRFVRGERDRDRDRGRDRDRDRGRGRDRDRAPNGS